MILWFLAIIYFNGLSCSKVLEFQLKNRNVTTLSSATPDISPVLPAKFVVCFTSFQKRLNHSSNALFSLYEDDQHQSRWLSLGLWSDQFVWADLNNNTWIKFSKVPLTWLRSWMSFCLDIDTETGIFQLSINGQSPHRGSVKKDFKENQRLYLRLGIVESSWFEEQFQFVGFIKSFEVFSHKILEKRPLESLSRVVGRADILNWNNVNWRLSGDSVKWVDEEDDASDLFPDEPGPKILIPKAMSFSQAVESCGNFGGNMTDVSDNTNATILDQLVEGDTGHFWVPFSDAEEEGQFKNIYNKKSINERKWFPNQPNGEESQNAVAYKKFGDQYKCYDEEEFNKFLSICTLHSDVLLTLIGACQHSFLGDLF